MTYNEKRLKQLIRKIHMEQLHFITKLLDIKDPKYPDSRHHQ